MQLGNREGGEYQLNNPTHKGRQYQQTGSCQQGFTAQIFSSLKEHSVKTLNTGLYRFIMALFVLSELILVLHKFFLNFKSTLHKHLFYSFLGDIIKWAKVPSNLPNYSMDVWQVSVGYLETPENKQQQFSSSEQKLRIV